MINADFKRQFLRTLVDEHQASAERWLRRGELQIAFARAFTEALPIDQTPGWSEAINRAQALFDSLKPSQSIDDLAATVQAAETEMQEIGRAAKQYQIHCVGHGHIDMNWMWSWPETVAATYDTFASVLSIMDQYPDFTFSQSQASVYALIERYYPLLFEQIKARVQEGRWEVTAAHWVEGDKNIASGESLCRHLLYTRDYFQSKFGLSPEDEPVDWEPDTFGHAQTVPGIISQGAVKFYYCCRTGGGFSHTRIGEPRPPLYYWQAPDGARVLVNEEKTWYNSHFHLGANIALPLAMMVKKTHLHHWLNIYGVGNHGGGPTRAEIDYYYEVRELPIYPSIIFSTSRRYFEAIEQEIAQTPTLEIPTIAHELNFEFPGCYTSQSAIKRGNRFGENYLEEAETLAALGNRLYGHAYPAEQLREAWLNVLFNQFHDILPGSGVRETREHAQALFQEVGAITGAIKRTVTKSIAANIDTLSLLPQTTEADSERALAAQGKSNTLYEAGSGMGAGLTGISTTSGGGQYFKPYVVYNPLTWTRSERVIVQLYDTGFDPSQIVVLDDQQVAHPTLFISRKEEWGHDQITIAFDAIDVPALGYRTYLFCQQNTPASGLPIQISPGDRIDTPDLQMRFDRHTSGLRTLIDKRTGVSYLKPGARALGIWEYVTERSRGMTAWVLGEVIDAPIALVSQSCEVIGSYGQIGTANPLGRDQGFLIKNQLSVGDTKSSVKLSMMIHALEPRIDVTAEIDWREIGDEERGIPGLIIRFPLALTNLKSLYETPFGSVERQLFKGEEVPSLRYAYVEGDSENGKRVGVTLLQDCKYGHSIDGSDLCLRIVRSSFDPDHAPEVAQSTVRYSLYLHDQPANPSELTRLGAAWNHPLLVGPATFHTGDAPASYSFVNVLTPNVVLTSLKQAHDGQGLILRLVELDGKDTEAEVEFDAAFVQGLNHVTVTDVLERPITGSAQWKNNRLRVAIKALSFVTIRIN